MKKLFTLFLVLFASVGTMFAESGTCGENLTWDLTDGVLTISGTGEMTNWREYSFVPWDSYRNNINCVIIGNSVSNIGNWAFYKCSGLTSIEIPNSVTSIGSRAFAYCCLTSVTIPNSVTSIETLAFAGCSGLKSVGIPNSVTSIGSQVFQDCSSLKSIEIPNSVTNIGAAAFYNCTSLTSCIIPNSITHIGEGAFMNVANIIYSGTAVGSPWGARSINGYVDDFLVYRDSTKTILFACVSTVTGAIKIPNGVTGIGSSAFVDCSGITSIDIPNSVTLIGRLAFWHCSGLTSITIPNSVTNIGSGAFENCTGLTTVTCMAMTPPELGYDAFSSSSQITLYVPEESIDAYKTADQWNDFGSILPISAKETETTDVQTTTTDNSVDILWPKVDNAYTYEIVIKDKDGNIVCTLVFNAQGQLTSIAFNAPARGEAPQNTQTAGFAFTVTGLESNSTYNYTVTAKDESSIALKVEEGSFTTKAPQGIEDIHVDSSKAVKVLQDGQIYILRGEHVYDTQGKMVR